MRKFIITVLFCLFSFIAFADYYKVNDVSYDTTGFTRSYALSQKIPVDTVTVFKDFDSFEKYIDNLRQQLNNQRIFQSSEVTLSYLEKGTDGIIPVNVLITTVDTLNIIGVPYPSYDSNSGITLKIKVKDYNFLGSMETMNFDLNYQAKGTDNLEDAEHIYGLNFGFSIPFNLVKIPANWTSDFTFSYTVENPALDMNICEGISFSIPMKDITSLVFSFKQYYIQDCTYLDVHDDKYFEEAFGLSLPFTVASIPGWSSLTWSPSIFFHYVWDFDVFKGLKHGGICSDSLLGPKIVFSETLSGGRINWIGNFRDGSSLKLSQTFRSNLFKDTFTASMSIASQYHKKLCSFIGFSTQQEWYNNFSDVQNKFGSVIRGVRDKDWESSDYISLNFDLPISLFHTDWGKLIGWDKLNFFNFELQISPFVDIVVGDNTYASSKYKLKDGWYGTGLEAIVFPDKFRSIQVRASFGVDAVQFLKRNEIAFADSLFNTAWREDGSSGWYELSIGVGLFY